MQRDFRCVKSVNAFLRAYFRASTDDQDANRARDQLQAFAFERGLTIAAWYVENESGATLSLSCLGSSPTRTLATSFSSSRSIACPA